MKQAEADPLRIDPIRARERSAARRSARAKAEAATAAQAEELRRTPPSIPVPMVLRTEERSASFTMYRPDAAFLAQLIAMRDAGALNDDAGSEATVSYRRTAASPRRRPAGFVVSASF